MDPPLYWIWLSSAFVGSNNDFDEENDDSRHGSATSLLLHLSSWYLYIAAAGAFFMASNWDLFSASLGALSLPHCWLFQSSRLQQTKKCNAAGVCVPRQKSAKLKLHASVACQWPTYLHDQLHQKSPNTPSNENFVRWRITLRNA